MSRKVDSRLTAIDLFAGCGGLTGGLRAAGFNVLAAIEKNPDAAATYAANHPTVLLLKKDIRRVTASGLLRDLKLRKGQTVDLIAGCPPCQGFTRLTENNSRRDPRNALIREYLRFVKCIRPKTCMLENVPGLLTRGKRFFNELKHGLEAAGYTVTYEVVQLADYGVPQFRKRLVLFAALKGSISVPRAMYHDPRRRSRRPWRTVKDAIGFLPAPPLRSLVKAGKAKPRYKWHYARDVAPAVRRRLEHALKDGKGRNSLPKSLRLACHERRPNGYHDVYGAMSWKTPSPTITSGCTNASKGRFGHPGVPRPITATEAALLQSFPATYRFKASGLESLAQQIGNALPKRFAKVAGMAVVKHLRGKARSQPTRSAA